MATTAETSFFDPDRGLDFGGRFLATCLVQNVPERVLGQRRRRRGKGGAKARVRFVKSRSFVEVLLEKDCLGKSSTMKTRALRTNIIKRLLQTS